MKTIPSIWNAFTKRVLTTALILGFGAVMAHAGPPPDFVLTDGSAQAIANQIIANPANTVQIVEDATATTGPSTAAANAMKIVSYLPKDMQINYAAKVGFALGSNYTSQYEAIIMQMATGNKNVRDHVSSFLYYMTLWGPFHDASEIALLMNGAMNHDPTLKKQINAIANALMGGIYNRDPSQFPAEDRATELALIAANLARAFTKTHEGMLSDSYKHSLKLIQINFVNYLNTVAATDPANRATIVRNAIGTYVEMLKNTLNSKQLKAVLKEVSKKWARLLPNDTNTINQAITDALNGTGSFTTGNINGPETHAYDQNHQP